jgi:protein-tyrosine phosphatase
MPTCQNINRYRAEKWHENLSPENWAWISIGEPEIPDSVISNHILDKLPNLKISFWDTTEIVHDVFGDAYFPPSQQDAAKIFQFIKENRNKNLIINCKAGKSRSGAICKFLEENLDYEWVSGKDRARPNVLLHKLLKQELDFCNKP